MKKLLTTITLSALVGTSASILQPMFAQKIVNTSFKTNKLNIENISIQNQSKTNPFEPAQINSSIHNIGNLVIAPNETIFVGTADGVYKSTDGGLNFSIIKGISNITITNLATDKDGNVYASDRNDKIYKSNGTDKFIEMSGTTGAITSLTTDKDGNVYAGSSNGTTYKSTDGNTFTAMSGTAASIKSLTTDKDGNVYAGSENGTVYKSTDGNTFTAMSGTAGSIKNLTTDKDGNVYAGTTNYSGDVFNIYKSNNGIMKFKKINNFNTAMSISSLSINNINNNIYVGTNRGLYQYNPINLLLKITKPDTFDKSWPLYNGIVYNFAQKIDIKDNLVASATLDGKSITIPTTDLDIPSGEHNLVLTLKDKSFANVFGGNPNTGQVTYKLWVKTSIDKNKIDYSTKIDDTQLYTGLVSNAGNTNGFDIIQTKSKDGSSHPANLDLTINDKLIDFDVNKSFYESGTVNEITNDFTATGTHQSVSQNLSIQNDGIYHLHLVDVVGNTYDSYLELGESNWKLTGTFNDTELIDLARKLNVIVNLTDITQKAKALGWLHQYENFINKIFEETIKTNGKGFDSEIKNQITSYTAFLKPLTYDITNEPKFDDGLDKFALVTTITDKANEILKNGLNSLPQNLNVDTKNVVNKSTLDNYSVWIKNYQDFIIKNKDKWINEIEKIASRGFATDEQENKIKTQVSEFLNNDNIKNYLSSVVWEDNKLLKATSSDYNQFIELHKLQSDTINWVNTNMKDINIAYQQAIKNAESDLKLHGYSISEILNGKQKPQTRSEIDNFADGQSYHEWLQSQANIKFHGWQVAIGFGIAIPLLLVVVAIGWVIRSRTNPKYHGYWRGRKFDNDKKKETKLSMKKNNKKEN